MKLGYGGTKQEMERLLADAQKLSGVEYNIDNLGDVYDAIHVIQQDLGLTGVAADEAKTTFTGSMGAMKASATNFLAALTTGGDVGTALTGLAQSLATFVQDNLMPMISGLIESVPTVLATIAPMIIDALNVAASNTDALVANGTAILEQIIGGISAALPGLISAAADVIISLTTSLTDPENIGRLVDTALNLLLALKDGLLDAIPKLVKAAPKIIKNLVNAFKENFPKILSTGVSIIKELLDGLVQELPNLILEIPGMIFDIAQAMVEAIPMVWSAGVDIIKGLAGSFIDAWPNLKESITTVVDNIKEGFSAAINKVKKVAGDIMSKIGSTLTDKLDYLKAKVGAIVDKVKEWFEALPSAMIDIGTRIVEGIWSGIKSAYEWLKGKIDSFVDWIVGGFNDLFAIGSPSKVMANEVGRWLPAGIAVGIEDNAGSVTKAMDALADEATGTINGELQGVLSSNLAVQRSAAATTQADTASLNKMLAYYLPKLADGQSININLKGGARGLFTAWQEEARSYTARTGLLPI